MRPGPRRALLSGYYATHAGMLRYVARDLAELARRAPEDARRLELYAAILERMVADLTAAREPRGDN